MIKVSQAMIMFLLQMLVVCLGILVFSDKELYYALCGMVILGVVFLLLRPSHGFALLVTIALISGFFFVVYGWSKDWNVSYQGLVIAKQAVILLSSTTIWLYAYTIKKANQEVKDLEQKLRTLKKYEEVTGVLTFKEFLEKTQMTLVSMNRRKEKGYYFVVDILPRGKEYKTRVIYEKMASVLLSTIRSNFDFVGGFSEDRMVVLLQNTHEQGVNVALERIKSNMRENKKVEEECVSIEIRELPKDWEEVQKELLSLTSRKGRKEV